MTWPELSRRDEPMHAFFVERYISAAAATDLATSTARLAHLCADTSVQYLYSAYLPTEDTCFCLFRAPSADAVREMNSRAGFGLDRIIDAVLLPHQSNG